jgi:hypothetical protein
VKTVFRIAAVAVIAVLAPVPTCADVPVWRIVKGDHSEYKILIDPRIAADHRLAFLLEAQLHEAEKEVREWEEFANEAMKEKTHSTLRQEVEKKLHLLGMTDQYAAILIREAQCSGNCHSGETVEIYQIARQALLKTRDILNLDGNRALLNRLAERDKDRLIGLVGAACNQPLENSDGNGEPDCLSLDDALDRVVPRNDGENTATHLRSSKDVSNFAQRINVGFTSDDSGRVTTLDIYIISDRKFPGHYSAYRWPLEIKDAAPLLKVALR